MPVAPLAAEYKPPTHLEHSYRFVALSDKAGEHALQESWATVCWKPALHQQCSMRLLPATEVESPGQSTHTCAPAAALNFPGTHAAHADKTDAPVRALAFPATQAVHVSGPVLVLYVPCRHAAQAKPLGPVYPRLQMHPACAAVPDGDCV